MDRSIAFYVSRFRRGTAAPVIRLSSGGFGDTFGGFGDDISRQGCRHLMYLAVCRVVRHGPSGAWREHAVAPAAFTQE